MTVGIQSHSIHNEFPPFTHTSPADGRIVAGVHNLFDKMSVHPEATSSCVLHIIITNLIYQVTEEVLDQLFDAYGVHDLCVSHKSTHMEVFVEFQSWLEASQAKSALHGRCIYDGCCLLDIKHAPPSISIITLPNSKSVVVDFDCLPMEPPTSVQAAVQGASSPLINELHGDAQVSTDMALVDRDQGGDVVMLAAITIAQSSSSKEANLGDHQMNGSAAMSDDIKHQLGAVTGMMKQMGSVPNQAGFGSRPEPWPSFPSITLLGCSGGEHIYQRIQAGSSAFSSWNSVVMSRFVWDITPSWEMNGFSPSKCGMAEAHYVFDKVQPWNYHTMSIIHKVCSYDTDSPLFLSLGVDALLKWDPGILLVVKTCSEMGLNYTSLIQYAAAKQWDSGILKFVLATCLCGLHQRSIQLAVLMNLSVVLWDPGIFSIWVQRLHKLVFVLYVLNPSSLQVIDFHWLQRLDKCKKLCLLIRRGSKFQYGLVAEFGGAGGIRTDGPTSLSKIKWSSIYLQQLAYRNFLYLVHMSCPLLRKTFLGMKFRFACVHRCIEEGAYPHIHLPGILVLIQMRMIMLAPMEFYNKSRFNDVCLSNYCLLTQSFERTIVGGFAIALSHEMLVILLQARTNRFITDGHGQLVFYGKEEVNGCYWFQILRIFHDQVNVTIAMSLLLSSSASMPLATDSCCIVQAFEFLQPYRLGNYQVLPSCCSSIWFSKERAGASGYTHVSGFCPFTILTSKLRYNTWDPGIHSTIPALLIEVTTAGARDACERSYCLPRLPGRNWSYIVLRLQHEQAIAWGQAMFCRGGSVTPYIPLDWALATGGWAVHGLGPAGQPTWSSRDKEHGEGTRRRDEQIEWIPFPPLRLSPLIPVPSSSSPCLLLISHLHAC